MSNYADRTKELKLLKKRMLQNCSATFLLAGKAYGITSFLKEKVHPYLIENDSLSFYINANSKLSLAESILSQVIKDVKLYEELQNCIDKSFGEKKWSDIFQDIPYLGNTISTLLSSKSALPLYTGNFGSAIEEILTIFFDSVSKDVVFLIDQAQNIFEDDYKIISDLILYNQAKFIFAVTEKNEAYIKLKNLIFLKGFSTSEVCFSEPHIELVVELGQIFKCNINQDQATKLLSSTNHNIHRIVEHFTHPHRTYKLSVWEKTIVSIMIVFKYPIPKKELFDIIKTCNLYSTNYRNSFNIAIENLLDVSIISENDEYYELSSINHPEVKNFTEAYSNTILYKNFILKYYKTKSNSYAYSSNLLNLLHDLSYELEDDSCKRYARLLIKYHFKNGLMIKRRIIDNAELKQNVLNDCLIGSITCAYKKDYVGALAWLKNVDITASVYIKSYYGILLNRVRDHSRAEKVLLEVLKTTNNCEIGAIVSSYLISNYVHQEKLEEAQKVYNHAYQRYKNARNFGYLIRNATSSFNDQRYKMYEEALECFLASNDMFGYYSTLANQGYHLLFTDFSKGINKLYDALEHLKLYSENLTQIVRNDLGIANLLQGNYDEANSLFSVVIANEHTNMSQIFARINLACCYLLMGNCDSAVNIMKELESVVENHTLDRVKQKYYINRLLIYYYSHMDITDEIIDKAKKYPDRYQPQRTEMAISFYIKNRKAKRKILDNKWKDLYSPCGLVYWVLNPLKIFPEGFVDQIIPI